MTFADSNRASIRAIAESTAAWAVLPGNGATREVRFTSSNLVANKETVVSDEIRADRMVSSIAEVGATSSGDLNFEFSAGTHDDFLQAFLLGTWSRPMTFDYFKGLAVAWTANDTITISGVDASGYFSAGRRIKTEGFVSPENNGYRTISAINFAAGNTTITTTETTATAEGATAFTKVVDANDVIILNSTNIQTSASGVDSNGNNEFASAVAAGQLKVGQRVYLDFAIDDATFDNYAITFSGPGADGDTIVISDGSDTKSFVAGIDYTTGAAATDTAQSLTAAINTAYASGQVSARAAEAAGVVTVHILTNSTKSTIVDTVDGNTEIAIGAKTVATNADVRGFFTLTSVGDDALGLSPVPSALAAGVSCSIKGSMLRNPGDIANIIPQSFSLETGFNDVGQFFLMTGMRVGTFSLEVSSGAIVTGSMAFNGAETSTGSVSVLGDEGTYTVLDSTATEVVNATANVGNLSKDGVTLSTAVQSITMEGDASLRDQMAVGSKFPSGIGTGRFNLTGTIAAYFQDLNLYNDFINHVTTSISWSFTDTDQNTYYFTIPALKITSDPIAPEGIDQDVMENMEWTAFRDAATECMLQVDRFSSVKAV